MIAIAILLALAAPATAATLFVAPGADPQSDCSQAAPCTLDRAIILAQNTLPACEGLAPACDKVPGLCMVRCVAPPPPPAPGDTTVRDPNAVCVREKLVSTQDCRRTEPGGPRPAYCPPAPFDADSHVFFTARERVIDGPSECFPPPRHLMEPPR